ncbi:hypothetical protein VCRA2122O339_70096 [Vibrio crassostreae]|nr:hypothetical protein VCRA2120E331_140097 [Vibrio crassostreae]CAK3203444.1 hypothetical protein VCRA2127O345_140042 [Vibrio crassostreae]CAK3233765.1 hypothetical protein VCRA2120E330_150096 [Vibrio crassostreae]CAK3240665.1 hypothetical protein VCRA2122O338_140042 [Vibrio crassostreae]CAK3307822.1 hypothetical protein VCRA2122O340_140042 [Vibrio crassostreae]
MMFIHFEAVYSGQSFINQDFAYFLKTDLIRSPKQLFNLSAC